MTSQNQENNKEKPLNSYMKYAGMGAQMGVIIGLAAWGGQKLDAYYENSKPIWTIVLCLLGIFGSLYLILKEFIGKRE